MVRRLFLFAITIVAITTWVSRNQSTRKIAAAEEDVAKADWESEGGAPLPDAT